MGTKSGLHRQITSFRNQQLPILPGGSEQPGAALA